MSVIKFLGQDVETVGVLPEIGSQAPDFELVQTDLSSTSLEDYKGQNLVLNIFPSIDTGTCAASVRRFNEEISKLENTSVLCVSADLPFAADRFCGAEGIENVKTGSTFRSSSFGSDYGVSFKTGPLVGLLSRAVVVVDPEGKVIYTEQVAETADEPAYEPVVEAVK